MRELYQLASALHTNLWHKAAKAPTEAEAIVLGDALEQITTITSRLYHLAQDEEHRLIAASPELLEACKRLLRAFESDVQRAPNLDIQTCWETNSQAIKAAREAIAKAEKETP